MKMIGIISINKKFMEFKPNELIDIIKENSKYVCGLEIFINHKDKNQIDYMFELAYLCKKNNLQFQVHGDSNLTIEEQKMFLNNIEKISDIVEYPINVVIHPKSMSVKNESVIETIKYTDELISIINLNKIKISLENLNDFDENDRLNKEDISSIVLNNEKLFMTYDIGHELIENGKIIDLNKLLISRLSNIHIHTYNKVYSGGYDHKPIYKNDEHWNLIIKSIEFLKVIKYEGPIVFEYDLYMCNGSTTKDKIISYCNSIDYVCERFY